MSRGYTLMETVTVLALLATTVATVAPAAARYRDLAAVISARERLAGLIGNARVRAVGTGGTGVLVRVEPGDAILVVGEEVTVEPFFEEGVQIDLGGRPEALITFDALGIGRLASTTVRLRRGMVERSLVVSSYGRLTRR